MCPGRGVGRLHCRRALVRGVAPLLRARHPLLAVPAAGDLPFGLVVPSEGDHLSEGEVAVAVASPPPPTHGSMQIPSCATGAIHVVPFWIRRRAIIPHTVPSSLIPHTVYEPAYEPVCIRTRTMITLSSHSVGRFHPSPFRLCGGRDIPGAACPGLMSPRPRTPNRLRLRPCRYVHKTRLSLTGRVLYWCTRQTCRDTGVPSPRQYWNASCTMPRP